MKNKPTRESINTALSKYKTQEQITRIIALVIAFVSVFIFFIKLLFFIKWIKN